MEMYLTYKKEQATTTSSRESNKREWEVEDRKQKQDAELYAKGTSVKTNVPFA